MDSGAHFHKCDFQVHTPRDQQWKGARPKDGAGRARYARSLIDACREKDLDAIAVTDHHDLAFFPYIREAALAESQDSGGPPIVVFPGVELTLGVPCQALLILDADFPEDRLDSVLTALGLEGVDPDAPKLGDVRPIDQAQSLDLLCQDLDKHKWLKGRYALFPNVTDGGHKTIMRKDFAPKYKDMPCVGGYVDGSIDKLGQGNKKITQGRDSKWGMKRIAVLQTSDSRTADHEKLGAHPTWIKWTQPTAEALRQACLAQESRISTTEPLLPSIVIRRLEVSQSSFLGPITIELNDQYNAIIGGRGTGKSTVLGYLRWALCDQQVISHVESEVGDPMARLNNLISATLDPHQAVVEVHFEVNGIAHVVRRKAPGGELTLKVGSGSFRKASERDVAALLPIHAYSQKQLSSVAVRLDELTRFVTAPIQAALDDADRVRLETTGKLRENYAALQRARDLEAGVQRSQLRQASLEEQAANLRKSIKGISGKDGELLASKPSFDAAARELRGLEDDRESVTRHLAASVDELHATAPDVAESDERLPAGLSTARSQSVETLTKAVSAAASAVEKAAATFQSSTGDDSTYAKAVAKVTELITDFEKQYAAVKKRSDTQQDRLDELDDLEGQKQEVDELLARQRKDLERVGNPKDHHLTLRAELLDLTSKRSELVADQCERLSHLSGGLIDASLHRGAGLGDLREQFQALIKGSGVRSTRVEAVFDELRADSDPVATWALVLDELETLMLLPEDHEMTSETSPTLSRLGLTAADQAKIRPVLRPDAWLDLLLAPILDSPEFRYQTKEDTYIEFASASAGQQATALLKVLLSQPGMPLLIDQPEEDLDSEIVLDIAEEIWTAKSRRQLIFASHNANLVVNGDAELVVVCENRTSGDQSGGVLRHQGAIDVPDVREAITNVMEGGERAFLLRKEKYGF